MLSEYVGEIEGYSWDCNFLFSVRGPIPISTRCTDILAPISLSARMSVESKLLSVNECDHFFTSFL